MNKHVKILNLSEGTFATVEGDAAPYEVVGVCRDASGEFYVTLFLTNGESYSGNWPLDKVTPIDPSDLSRKGAMWSGYPYPYFMEQAEVNGYWSNLHGVVKRGQKLVFSDEFVFISEVMFVWLSLFTHMTYMTAEFDSGYARKLYTQYGKPENKGRSFSKKKFLRMVAQNKTRLLAM